MGDATVTIHLVGALWEWRLFGIAASVMLIAGALRLGVEAWAKYQEIQIARGR